jgi:3-methylfumaryl-CoA hydratase
MSIEIDHLRSWIGREEVAEDVITSVPVAALAATLDRDDPKPQSGDELPPL